MLRHRRLLLKEDEVNQTINELCIKYFMGDLTPEDFQSDVIEIIKQMDAPALTRFAQEFLDGLNTMTDEPKATGLWK